MKLPDGFRRWAARSGGVRGEVREELRGHIEERIDELVAQGLDPASARERAEKEFGDVDRIGRESVALQRQIRRRTGGRARIESWGRDLRFAARALTRRPGPSVVIVVILALGIGAVTAVFGVVNAIFQKPLPGVRGPERIVEVSQGREPGDFISISYPVLARIAEGATVGPDAALESIAGMDLLTVAVADDSSAEPVVTLSMQVTGQYFRVLGTLPARGRLLDESDAGLDGRPVAVLADDFWRRRFDADPAIVGRTIRVNGVEVEIVGVAEAGFHGHAAGAQFDLWLPVGARIPGVHPPESLRRTRSGMLDSVARLAPGATREAALAQINTLADRLVQAEEDPDARYPLQLGTYGNLPGPARIGIAAFLGALLGITGVVLAITCVNVTNLHLARAFQRRLELAVRASLGAGRGRLVRQLVLESLLLFGAGALVGTLVANATVRWALSGAIALPIAGLRLALDLGLDLRMLLFSTALTIATGVVSGLVPALHATGDDLVSSLRTDAAREGGGRFRMREWMVGIQVAATLVLLVVSGLFVRSLQEIGNRDLGFRSERVQVASLDLQLIGLDDEAGTALWQELLAAARALPAVESASLAHKLPISSRSQTAVNVAGVEPPDGYGFILSNRRVSDDYFETLSIPIVRGRAFDERDRRGSPRTIILNETMAERLWPGEDPIGRRVYNGSVADGTPMEVVGVASDGVYHELDGPTPGFGFLPAAHHYDEAMILHLRLAPGAVLTRSELRDALHGVAPDLPLLGYGSLEDSLRVNFLAQTIAAWVGGVMGGAALLLAGFGLYGVTAFQASRRKREIGVRLALGATPRGVVAWTVRRELVAPAIGLGIGVVIAFALSRLLASLLIGVSTSDPLTFSGVTLLLAMFCALAAWLSARRAARLDPATTLRQQ